jgi:hypothetical protein
MWSDPLAIQPVNGGRIRLDEGALLKLAWTQAGPRDSEESTL